MIGFTFSGHASLPSAVARKPRYRTCDCPNWHFDILTDRLALRKASKTVATSSKRCLKVGESMITSCRRIRMQFSTEDLPEVRTYFQKG